MSTMTTMALSGFVILLSIGQILFKISAERLELPDTLFSVATIRALIDPVLIAALTLYGVATILWVLILREVDLSRAYPFTAISFALVPAIAIVVFGEEFSWALVAGGALMIAGMYIIVNYA